MKNVFFLMMLMLATPLWAEAAEPSLSDLSGLNLNPQALSPDGHYLVGCKTGYGNWSTFEGFCHDLTTGQTSWLTSYDETDYTKSGSFLAVNNAGQLAGYFKDIDHALESYDDWFDETTYFPLAVAAVWNNGNLTSLGLAGYGVSDFEDENDGTRVAAISADGKTAVGYVVRVWMPVEPVGWQQNEAGEWETVSYNMPQDAVYGAIYTLSGDGKTAGGQVSIKEEDGPCYYPVIWQSPTEPLVIKPEKVTAATSGNVIALSNNGHYALISFDPLHVAVYDIQTGAIRYLPVAREVTSINAHAIANNGDAIVSTVLADYTTKVAQYYDYAADAAFNLDYYARFHAADVALPGNFCALSRYMMSADGTLIVASDGNGKVYTLTLDGQQLALPRGVEQLNAFTSAPLQITLSWNAAAPQAGEATLTGYRVRLDGQEIAMTNDLNYVINDVAKGQHNLGVAAVYGGVSAPEAEKQLMVNPQALPFFENFDDQMEGVNGNVWDRDYLLGNVEEWIAWSVWPQEYNNVTPHIVAAVTATEPYRAVLSSQFLTREAQAEAEPLRLSCIVMATPINSNNQDFSHENLLIQASTDGQTWQTLQTINAGNITKYVWMPVNIALPYTAEPFKFRLSAEGEGVGMIMWRADNINITDAELAPAPQGLRGEALNNGTVRLDWLDPHHTTPVSHLANLHTITDQCAGNEGNGLIAAVALDAQKMAPHIGEYISSVSAFIYDGLLQYAETDVPTTADVVIWEEGVKIVDQPIQHTFNAPTITRVKLDQPVPVKANANYLVGVRIHEGRCNQEGASYYFTPMYYSNQDARTGITDLYSEDNGTTWKNLYDAYNPNDAAQDKYRNCVWDIVANVTAAPEQEQMDAPAVFGYEVMRQGERLTDGMAYPYTTWFVDEKPLDAAQYAVRAYYENGQVSALSEPVSVVSSGIQSVAKDMKLRVWPNPCKDIITIDGGQGAVSIYNMNGNIVLKGDAGCMNVSALPAGLYLLKRGKAVVKFIKQ